MGIIKWLKKEWENNSRNSRRLSLPPKLPSELNTVTSRNLNDDLHDPLRTVEYSRALSQFLERRTTISPQTSNFSGDFLPYKPNVEKPTIDEKINCHNEHNLEIKLSEIENVKSQIDMFHQNDLLNTMTDKQKKIDNSPNNSNSSQKSKPTNSNSSIIKYDTNGREIQCANNVDLKNGDNRNTSSSVNYEKFSFGNIHTSLDQHDDKKNSNSPNNKICFTSSASLNTSPNTLNKVAVIENTIPKITLSDDNIAFKLSTSLEIEHGSDLYEIDQHCLSVSPSEYFKPCLDNLDGTITSPKDNSPQHLKQPHDVSPKSHIHSKFTEDTYKNDKPNYGEEIQYSDFWDLAAANAYSFKSYEDIKCIMNKIEQNTFQFGPYRNYFSNIPIIKYSDVKWNSKRDNNCNYHCEWKSASWNNIKVVARRVKPYSKVKCEELLEPELKILSTIRHPNIILLMGITVDTIYKIIPIYEHFRYTLYTHMYKMANAVPLQKIINYTYQICEGLNYLHQFNIIHSAISSHNIILDCSLSTAKLCCFDAAISLYAINFDNKRHTIRKKWYRWMAPELLDYENSVLTTSADVYSLCLVFWECCIMKVPFQNLSYNQLKDMYFTWKMEIKIPESIFPTIIYKMLTKGLVINSNRNITITEMLKILKLAEIQLSSKKDIFIFLKIAQFHHPDVKVEENNKNENFSVPQKGLNFKLKTCVNNDSSTSVSPKSLQSSDIQKNENMTKNNMNNHNERLSNNCEATKRKNQSGVRIENTITFIRKPKKQTSADHFSTNNKLSNYHTEPLYIPNQLQCEQLHQTPKNTFSRSVNRSAPVDKQHTSLPSTPFIKRKSCIELRSSQRSLPNTPIARNTALRKYKWLSDNGCAKQNIDSDTSISDFRDPYTGLRKVPQKNHYNSDSQIGCKNLNPCSSITISPIINIKKIVETHESWIKDSISHNKSPILSPNLNRNIAVKPASHRIEIIPELKPQPTAPVFHLKKKDSTRSLYACMPTPIRDAVTMKKVLNEEMKNFFEGSLWKQEKIKCLSKMKNGVNERSVLHNILQAEANADKNKSIEENTTEKFLTNEIINTENERKPLFKINKEYVLKDFPHIDPKYNNNDSNRNKTNEKKNPDCEVIEITKDEFESKKNENHFIKDILICLIDEIVLKNKIIDESIKNNLIPDKDTNHTSENSIKYTNSKNKDDILIIYEINTQYSNNRDNKKLEQLFEKGNDQNTIRENNQTINTTGTSEECVTENKKSSINRNLNKTYDVIDDSSQKQSFQKCEGRTCKSLECLNSLKHVHCSACGSLMISTNTEHNETHSQTDVTNDDNNSEMKLKRCRGFTKIADINSTEDIYFDDEFSPDNVACHMQLSPMSNFNNSDMYNATLINNSSLIDEEISELLVFAD